MRMRYLVAFTILAAIPVGAQDDRGTLIRERYEQVLARDPLQAAAFDRVYESYMLTEGVDAWLEKLQPAEGAAETAGGLVLRGRILARQFKAGDAVEALSKAREMGETSPAFDALLGRLYYETGKDADAIALLGAALDATESPEQRSELCRMLGSVYLRSGKRAEAAAVWERIAALNPGDLFALQELAEIYEENRMWDEAIAARTRIVEAAANDPYRQCHAWRAIGQSLLAKDDFAGAIAAFEQGLALAAPGNWLFEDLKGRLVGVYESRGDLEGLSAYLEARIAQDTSDLSLSELLADVTVRRGDLAKAEGLLKEIVARSPGRVSTLEILIGLYRQAGRMEDLAATFEVLIAQYPAEPDYLRRLGEAWLEQKSPEKARETWRRVLGDGSRAGSHALLAEWLERSEFFPEAASAYEAALAIQPDREWRLRLASLKYDMGEEEAALAAWQAAVVAEDTPAGEVTEIAAILLSKELKAEAEALYARAMVLEPENLDHVLAYARLLSGRADHAGAVVQYTRLAEQDTSEYLKNEGERGLLDSYEALGTLETQRAAWEEAVAQAPDDTVARLKLARLYARLGMRPGVVILYEACAGIDPARIEFQRLLAEAYKENRQTDKAVAVLEGLMEKDAGRAQAYLRDLLALYGASGRAGESVRVAEKLVELSPSSPEARTALAQVYLRNGEVEKGLQQYRSLIQLDGTQPAYYRDFGDALQQNGKFGEAQEAYRKMLDAAADDTTRLDAVNRLASVYVRNGQRDVLLSEFQRRVSAAPKSLPAYQELAAVYRAAGNARGALETLERAQGEVEDRDAVLRLVMAEAFQAGDHPKVLAAYEELVERSAQPTAYDLDRLADAYAQVGRMDEALTVWDRVAREHPDDAAVQLMVARQLEGQGLYDESNACTERALEIDPYDHDLRFDYAQRLIGFNEVDRALEQMQKILDIGARPEAAQANGAGTPSAVNAGVNTGPNLRPQQGFGGGRSRWSGQTFGDLRQQVVQSMVQASRQFDDVEPLIETYRKRIEAQPENIDARRDYLLVCEASNENARALEAATALLALQPDDAALRWRIFGYLQELGRVDEALAAAAELSALPDVNLARQARLMRIRLLAENNRFDEAAAVLAELTADTPEMAQIYLQVAGSFQHAPGPEIADRLYQKAAELDPRFRHHALTGRARLLQERGEGLAARDLYLEAVFAPPADGSNPAPPFQGRNAAPLYMPQGARRGRQPSNNVSQLPGYNYPMLDHQRAEALNQAHRLTTTPEEFAPVIARLREASAKYATAASEAQRQEASNFVCFLVACLRNTDRDDEAVSTVQALLAQLPGDLTLQNLLLYLFDEQGQFDGMKAVYAEVESSNPSVAGDVARARLQLALAQGDIAAIPGLFRVLPAPAAAGNARHYGGNRASQLNTVVRTLENAGARNEARALLEEELLRSRDAGVLILLSRSYAAEESYDQAIAYAREAYEKQGGIRARGGNSQYSMNAMTLQTQGLYGLEVLWNAYREAGREGELIAEFEARIEGQPTSVTLRQSLAGLYMESRQYDLARAQMEKLLELRPNDVPLKVRYAGLLEADNDPAGALALLESVASSRPSAAMGIAGEIRRLYKDLGKKAALAALDEKMIREARSTSELQQLARQLGEDKEYARAAELMQRALRIEPENTWLLFQIGDYLWQAEKKAEAAEAYLKFFQPASPQAGIQIDGVGWRLPEIIQRIAEAGRLEDLKAIAAAPPPDEFSARSLRILGALIARHEKRPDDAEQMLKAIVEGNPDQQVYSLLADMAEAKGDLPGAIHYLEATITVAGATDFRRVAMLYLRAGDTEKSILNWKKFAEQHGGYFAYDEAIRSLAEAAADEALSAYFREVYGAIPATDPARQQLAQTLIRLNQESGRFDALIDGAVFTADNKYAGEIVREFVGDYQMLPGAALRRIVPLAGRYPQDARVQALHAEILGEAGKWEEALAIYEGLMQQEVHQQDYGDAYANALRRAGQLEKHRDVLLARLRAGKNPPDDLVWAACNAVVACGGVLDLSPLREELLAAADPARQFRIEQIFLSVDAANGNMASAHDALRALVKDSTDSTALMAYFQFLVRNGFPEEAASVYRDSLIPQGGASIAQLDARDTMRTLLAAGDPEGAWAHLALMQRQQEGYNNSGSVAQALEQFQEYNVPAFRLDRALDALRSEGAMPLKDRFFLVDTEIALGRFPAAIALLKDHRDNHTATQILSNAASNVPAELREGLGISSAPPDSGAAPAGEAGTAQANPVELARALIRTAESAVERGDKAKAITLLDGMAIEDATRLLFSARARVYSAAGAFDKAIADFDAHLAANPEDWDSRKGRVLAKVGAGKFEEAMEDWRAINPSGRNGSGLSLAGGLVDQKRYDDALSVLEDMGPQRALALESVVLRARILHETGQDAALVALMEERYPDFSESSRDRFAADYGDLLAKGDLWKSLTDEFVSGQRPALAHALLRLAQGLQDDEHLETRQLIADRLSGVVFSGRQESALYSNLLDSVGRRGEAVQVLLDAAERPEEDALSDGNLVDQLYNLEAYAEAVRTQLRLAERVPELLARGSFLLHMAEKAGDPALVEEAGTRLMAAAPTGAARAYFSAIQAWYGPDKADGKAKLVALVDVPEMTQAYLEEIAQIFSQEEDEVSLVKVRTRIARGEFGSEAATMAGGQVVELYQKSGNLPGALDAFVSMLPAVHDLTSAAFESVLACAVQGPFETADRLILERVQAAPAHPAVSDLLALRAKLASRMGVVPPPLDLVAMGVPGEEVGEAKLWGNLIDTWAVSKPVEMHSWTEMSAPLDEALTGLLRGDAPAAAGAVEWRAAEPREILPHISEYGAAWPEGWTVPQDYATYCLAEIESPDDRTVTLAHGSAGWSRIRVNETEVYSNPYTRVNLAGTDRFDVALKKGLNRVLVRICAADRGASFSLSIMENSEGLAVRAPALAAAPAAGPAS